MTDVSHRGLIDDEQWLLLVVELRKAAARAKGSFGEEDEAGVRGSLQEGLHHGVARLEGYRLGHLQLKEYADDLRRLARKDLHPSTRALITAELERVDSHRRSVFSEEDGAPQKVLRMAVGQLIDRALRGYVSVTLEIPTAQSGAPEKQGPMDRFIRRYVELATGAAGVKAVPAGTLRRWIDEHAAVLRAKIQAAATTSTH